MITLVQSVGLAGGTGTPLTLTITPTSAITSGNTIVVPVIQNSTSSRTYVVSDNIDGTTGWVREFRPWNGLGGPEFWVKANAPAGITTITVTHNSSSVIFRSGLAEFSGMNGVADMIASDSLQDAALTATHYCSASGLTTVDNVVGLILGGPYEGSNYGTDSQVTGSWNDITSNAAGVFAYQIFPTGCTNERGQFTNTGTNRLTRGAIILLRGLVIAPPTLTDISPNSGPNSGGTNVTLTGTDFNGVTSVTFDGVPATDVVTVNSTTVTCTTPAGTIGAVDVVVTNVDNQTDTLVGGFTYNSSTVMEVIQEGALATVFYGSTSFTIPASTPGSTICVMLFQIGSAVNRDYGASDNVNGPYTSIVKHKTDRGVYAFELRNNVGGDLTVSFSLLLGGGVQCVGYWWEMTGIHPTAQLTVGTFADAGNTTSHPCSAAPGLSVQQSIILTGTAFNSTTGLLTPAANYTQAATIGIQSQAQHRVADFGVTDDQAIFRTGTSRTGVSVQIAFPVADGIVPPEVTSNPIIMHW